MTATSFLAIAGATFLLAESQQERYIRRVLDFARWYIGTVETSRDSGPGIDDFLRYVGSNPGSAWCAAFVSAMHGWGASSLGLVTGLPVSASVTRMYRHMGRSPTDGSMQLQIGTVRANPGILRPGDTVHRARDVADVRRILDDGAYAPSHVGLVEEVSLKDRIVFTIEGNTPQFETRGKNGVWRSHQQIDDPHVFGFGRAFGMKE